MLLNEVKGIRSRLQNLITFEGRINDFDEFMEIINKIKNYIYQSDDKDIQQSYEQLCQLIENYEINGQKYYNKIIQEIFGINYCDDDEIEFNNDNDENINYENDEIDYNNDININEFNDENIDNYDEHNNIEIEDDNEK